MPLTVTIQRRAAKGRPALFLVKNPAGSIVGMVEKYRDTRTEKHPYKAFAGVGMQSVYLGACYGGMNDALDLINSNLN